MAKFEFRQKLRDIPCYNFGEGIRSLVRELQREIREMANAEPNAETDLSTYDAVQMLTVAQYVETTWKEMFVEMRTRFRQRLMDAPSSTVHAFCLAMDEGNFGAVLDLPIFAPKGGA